MRMLRVLVNGHRSVEYLDFDAGPFTVLFGKNNAGKTNILETLHGIFVADDPRAIRRTHAEGGSRPEGAAYFELEPGIAFDDSVLAVLAASSPGPGPRPTRVAFTGSGLLSSNLDSYWAEDAEVIDPGSWIADVAQGPDLHALFLDWQYNRLHERVEASIAALAASAGQKMRGDWPWLEALPGAAGSFTYRVPWETERRVAQLASLATDMLPDFVDGAIGAHVTSPTLWGDTPKVLLTYDQRGQTQCADLVDAAGEGAARWMAAAVQIALNLMEEHPELSVLRDIGAGGLSGLVLLIDEPEAHLHPSAVASMVRWCHRMVHYGSTVIVATHHEEFLRTAGDDVTLVHVTRNPDLVLTSARTLPSRASERLKELAVDIGMHPAAVLSLHRAILFVEGPLDEAVLDEFGGLKLDSSGVKIIPIHGTKNLEGLVAVDLVTELGIKLGVLTDATDPTTMTSRSGKKRSSEEKKVLRVLQIAAEKGLDPPKVFGVSEDDLLFTLPPASIRDYLDGPFPEWHDLVAECRSSLGKGPADSVNWKAYALDRYGLPINTPAGVRELVRHLDLKGVPLPSIQTVINDVVDWAMG